MEATNSIQLPVICGSCSSATMSTVGMATTQPVSSRPPRVLLPPAAKMAKVPHTKFSISEKYTCAVTPTSEKLFVYVSMTNIRMEKIKFSMIACLRLNKKTHSSASSAQGRA